MANDPQVGFGNTKEAGDIRASLFVKETHDDDGAFAFAKTLHAASKLIVVQTRCGHWKRLYQIGAKSLEDTLFSLNAAALIQHRHAARTQHEVCQFFRFAQAASAQSFDCRHQYHLCQIIRRRFVSQVA
jgi:hypothetical protein